LIDSYQTRVEIQNWIEFALNGGYWALVLDAGHYVDVRTAVNAARGALQVFLTSVDGIVVGRRYKLFAGPNYQLLTVTGMTGTIVQFSDPLNFDIPLGAIFQDEYYYVGLLLDNPYPLETFDKQIQYPPSRYLFTIEFLESTEVGEIFAMDIFRVQYGNATAQSNTSVQPWFPAQSGVMLAADTTYHFEGFHRLDLTNSTGGPFKIAFGGTISLATLTWNIIITSGPSHAEAAITFGGGVGPTFVKTLVTGAVLQSLQIFGTVRTSSTAGTFIPQFKFDNAPTGATTVGQDSYFMLTPLGNASVQSGGGVWS
jgi:hypothetical protein